MFSSSASMPNPCGSISKPSLHSHRRKPPTRQADLGRSISKPTLHSLRRYSPTKRAAASAAANIKNLRMFRLLCSELSLSGEACPVPLGPTRRIDLKAAGIMKANGRWPPHGAAPIIGAVPGVEIGDEFIYRMELAVVRLHRPLENGIDYDPVSGFATSIVASGEYSDYWNFSEGVLNYTGMGGNYGRGKGEARDQKMEGGNLAMKRSMEAKKPVRVIYGFKGLKGNTTSVFLYDGLYLVEDCRKVIGNNDGFVFEFQLRRIPGQPDCPKTKGELEKLFRRWLPRCSRRRASNKCS